MKKNRMITVGILTAVCISAAGAAGCSGRTYDAVLVPVNEQEKRLDEGTEAAGEDDSRLETSALHAELAQAPAPAFTEVNDTIYIKGNQVRLRTVPSTADSNTIAAVLNNGTALNQTGDSDDWCRVSYGGQTLYVSKGLVTAAAPAAAVVPAVSESQPAAAADSGNTGKTELSDGSQIFMNDSWKYADYSAIKSGAAVLYRSSAAERKEITVCVNAGHGTSGGESVKTLCHPDGTAKVTGGTTGAGATKAAAVSGGMTFADGTPERNVTLALAKTLKEKLLAAGYDVVMIRESDDVQLDNIARTVIANNTADCHIALHWDSTTSDKGAFYMSVPDVASYRAMEPVASNWQKHNALGENLIAGLRGAGVKIFSGGSMAMDLTQTSYSTIPSVDIELGDKVSDHSAGMLDVLAQGLLAGINGYFGK